MTYDDFNIQELRARAIARIAALRQFDNDDADRHEAYLELGWNDRASILDLLDCLHHDLVMERKLLSWTA